MRVGHGSEDPTFQGIFSKGLLRHLTEDLVLNELCFYEPPNHLFST